MEKDEIHELVLKKLPQTFWTDNIYQYQKNKERKNDTMPLFTCFHWNLIIRVIPKMEKSETEIGFGQLHHNIAEVWRLAHAWRFSENICFLDVDVSAS